MNKLTYQLLKSADVKRLMVITTLLFWCTCMIAVRIDRTGSGYYVFLLGNLFLACVPLFFSTALRVANRLRLQPRLSIFRANLTLVIPKFEVTNDSMKIIGVHTQ